MNTNASVQSVFSDTEVVLNLLTSGSDEMLLLVDRDLTIRFYNDTAKTYIKKLLGKTLTIGFPVLELAPEPAKIPFFKAVYKDAFNGSSFEGEEEVVLHGKPTIYEYHVRPATNAVGVVMAAIVTVYDVTQKRATEKALKVSEERLRFALEGSNYGIWDWDIQTGDVFFSPFWKKMLGFSENEVKNHIDEWKARVHPDDKEQLALDLETHFKSGQAIYENRYRLRAKDGTYKWIQGRGKIVAWAPDGTPLRMIGTHTDITEKRESEEQYRNLFDITPLPTWIYDFETLRFLAVNQAAINHYGFSKAEFLQMTIMDVRPPEYRNLLKEVLPDREQKAKTTYANWKHRKKNGEVIHVELNTTTIWYNGCKARLVVVNDITQKVTAEVELKQGHQRFQYVSKATSDAIYELDLAKGHLVWGDGLTTLFGHAVQEISLEKWETYIHPDERETVIRNLNETIYNSRKKFWKKEYRFLKADNTYRYVIDKGFILRNDQHQPVRMIGAMQDITNLKQQQLDLAESNKRYEYATLATSDIIWDWIIENEYVLWSDNYEKAMGWKLPGSKCLSLETCLERFHENDRERVYNSMMEALQSIGQNTWETELRYKKSNGETAHIYNRAYILRNEAGAALRMIGAMQDVSQRKKLEEQLLQEELDKQRIISKATIDTQERERSEIGKELHDNVNQVLTTTKLYLELALANAGLKDELLQKSQRNVIYVINEIRQLSRSLMNPSLGDLGLIDSIHDLIENVNATGKIQVVVDTTEAVTAGLSDTMELTIYRIIQEALNNAVKHSQATTVLISLQKKEDGLELYIQDNGIGFNPAALKKGAGLKNIKNRVYLTNGTLRINSALGAGCTLTILFNLKNTTIQ